MKLFHTVIFIFSIGLFNIPSTLFAQTNCDDNSNMAGIYPCNSVNLMSFMDLSTLGATSANDIWGWKSPNTNKEYAIIGLRNGYAFVDVTDPVNPVKIGNLPTHSDDSTWGDIKVNDNYAYLVSEAIGHHIQVFHLFQLDNVNNPPVIFDDTNYSIITIGNGKAHNIVMDEESDFAYTVGTNGGNSLCSAGLAAHDISDPTNPSFAGCFSADGYSHDAMCFIYRGEDTEHIGKQICIGFNEDAYTIVDMTNKNAPIQLSSSSYAGVSYTHQGWVTDDHKYLLLNDETDEQGSGVNTSTYIFDLSDLDNPFYMYTHLGTSSAIDHNLYVKGSYAYQTNYAAGLRILDLTNIGTTNGITEVAYFDFYPANNNASFVSVWSNYPYFKSGNILISDFEQGLFVVQPQLPHFVMDFAEREGVQETCTETSVSYEIDLTAYAGFSNSVALSIDNNPPGTSVSFSNNNTNPDGNTIVTVSGVDGLATGNYHLLLTATATGSPMQKLALGLQKKTPQTLAAPNLVQPTDEAIVADSPTLEWTTASGNLKYELQVATDANFNNLIVDENDIATQNYQLSNLNADATYYWRTKITPPSCASSDWSAAFSFQVLNQTCTDFESTDVPLNISDEGTPTIVSTFNVSQSGIISDLNISINIEHTYTGDLEATLTSPNGTIVSLFNRPGVPASQYGCNQDNIIVTFDDMATNNSDSFEDECSNSGTAIAGDYQPIGNLSDFNGENMAGFWSLSIKDNFDADGGNLIAWSLNICSPDAVVLPVSLMSFHALAQTESILLSWQVANQFNNKGFEILRSTSPREGFKSIGWLDANNAQEKYEWEDKDVVANTTYYYQLQQEDHNGKTTPSATVQATITSQQTGFTLVPNPAKDQVRIKWTAPLGKENQMEISILTLDGKVVQRSTYMGINMSYPLSLTSLNSGVYLVKVQSEDGVEVRRLVRQ